MPRWITLLLLLTVLLLFCHIPATATVRDTTLPAPKGAPPACSAASMALLEPESGSFLALHNADERRPMASTTKIMTALVVLETLPREQVITVPREAVGTEGSSIYLYEGERISVNTLLYALLLSSANDAAVALALAAGGSIEGFAAMMNEKAVQLGLSDTHFCNPHGLHDEAHYTTARDLARLCAAALKDERFAQIAATRRFTAPQEGTGATRLFLNHNRLLRTYDGAIGGKTGFTKAAGRCLVSAARRNGLTLIAVTLSDPNDWRDHTALLDFGFSEYEGFCPETPSITLPVVGGSIGEVTLAPATTLSLILPTGHPEITCTAEHPRFLYGGFAEGEQKGRLVYHMGGEVIGEIPLVTKETCEPLRSPGLWERIFSIFKK